jgi:hypothetical protein
MRREQYAEAKRTFDELTRRLKEDNLTPEEQDHLRSYLPGLSGVLHSIWFPFDWGRRTLMILIFIVGIFGLIQGYHDLMWIWLALPAFSPRIIGEAFHLLGRTQGLGR